MANIYQIGPAGFDTGTNAFILSTPEWLSIQCYVTGALNLPVDKESLRKILPIDPQGEIDNYNDLLAGYKDVHDHCQYWQDHTLPDSINCAADIVHYNEKVPIYYGALTKLLPQLELNPPDPDALKQFQAILQNLSYNAKGYADHADLVAQGMKTFAEQSFQDQQNTIKPLLDKYEKELGDQSPEIKQLNDELITVKDELKNWNNEYEHDVIVSSTSATYAWIWPFGTVAAAVVAGVYGKKATDALKKVHECQAKIDNISTELQSHAILLLDLQRIHRDLGDISEKLNNALPIIQKIQGIWTAIHTDLEDIMRIIEEDINQVPAIIKSLGIDEAIQAWNKIAKEADDYRVNAYIKVTTEEEAKIAGEQMQKTA